MDILLTGATGFVGQNLTRVLIANSEHNLFCLVRNAEKARKILGGNVELITMNEIDRLKNIHLDAVVHLASFLTSMDDEKAIDNILEANIIFGVKLMNAIRDKKGLKFINFGSSAEYRNGTGTPDPAYFYTATKRAFRPLLDYFAALADWDYVHLIPYTIYGGVNNQKKLIDYVHDSLYADTPVLMSPGFQVSDLIHVNDVIDCIQFFLDNFQKWEGLKGEEYHLGTGIGTSIRELASLFEEMTGKKCNIEWGGRPYRERDVMYAVAPIGKLKDLGWMYKINLQEGLKEYI